MPLYMDRHYIEGATKHAVATAHNQDLAIQDKYHITFVTYWFDEVRSTAFCLVEAPDKAAIQAAHNEAHGSVPNEILEVDPSVVEAFLGRVKDPTPLAPSSGAVQEELLDAAFRTIMFTDLKDSTRMTVMLGDQKALHLLHIHNALTRAALQVHGGHEVKHTGDGIMASFGQAGAAVACAMEIQRAFARHNQDHPEAELYLRIGLSAGEPIEEHGDLFGNAVQLAARICTHAEPGQILVAQVVRDACPDQTWPFSDGGEIRPKGFDQAIRVYEVIWAER